MVKKENQP